MIPDRDFTIKTTYDIESGMWTSVGSYVEDGIVWALKDIADDMGDAEDTVLIACMRRWYDNNGRGQ